MRHPGATIGLTGVCWLALIVVSFVFLDRPIAQFAHDHLRDPLFDRGALRHRMFLGFTDIAAAVEPLAVWGLAVVGLGALIGWRSTPLGRLFIAAAVAALVAQAAKNELKFAFGRTWPETWIGDNPSFIRDGVYGFFPFHGGDGWASFPSGHTTLIATPMTILWLGVPRLRWLAILLTVLVIIGLIGLDYHFFSDCLAGIALGVVVGTGVARLFDVRPPAPPPA